MRRRSAVLAGVVAAVVASHSPAEAHAAAPTATLRWTEWTWDPGVVGGLLLLVVAYLWMDRRAPASWSERGRFSGGIAALGVALLSPLDAGAHLLFTLHMIQHMVLLVIAPPLLALALPAGVRRGVIRALAARSDPGAALPSFEVGALYNGVMLAWHLPAAYDAALRDPLIHAAEHASFVGAGVLFWSVVLSPLAGDSLSPGARLLLVGASDVACFLLALGLLSSSAPLYQSYLQAPRLWGFSPLEDQRLGGAAMWVLGQLVYTAPELSLILTMLGRDDTRGAAFGD